jgi:hypothetical protein
MALKDFIRRWAPILKAIARQAIQQSFPSHPFHISECEIELLTKKVLFSIKAQRIPTSIKLSAEEIINDEKYLIGLSLPDRLKIKTAYLQSIERPKAYIEEYPIYDEGVFKIVLINDRKIICATASYLVNENKDVLFMLRKEDIINIVSRYYEDRQSDHLLDSQSGSSNKKNIYLKLV